LPESDPGKIPEVPFNFLALNYDQSRLDQAKVVLIPVPYDSTTSLRAGAREGPNAIIQASNGLEDYDWELDLDVSELGIHTTAALEPHMGGPEQMLERVKQAVAAHVRSGKIVGLLGGEHSLSVGAVQAHLEAFPDLSVLYLDAHADLRDEFMGTR
jgi:agmatinase